MHGLRYSLKEYFRFSGKELREIIWTSIAYALILTFRQWGIGKTVDIQAGISHLIIALIFVFLAMYAHVSLQKIVAIRLGYTATYQYWLNGLLFCVVLAFLTNGASGVIGLILPGAITVQLVPKLRLGKFRFGVNLKDVARIGMAGSIAHILLVMIFGFFYFYAGRSDIVFTFMVINLFLAVYSMLPIPKIDVPTKMDSGSDGLAVFFFSRTLYILIFVTVLVFSLLVFFAISYATLTWLFFLSFALGCLASIIYSKTIEQSN